MRWLPTCTALSALLALVLTACGDDSCYDNGSSLPLARFYTSGTSTTVTVLNLTMRGIDAPGDSILIDNSSVSECYLPLRATVGTTQYELSYGDDEGETLLADTITFSYRPVPYFASHECGAMYNFEMSSLTSTHHVIDSVVLVNKVIDNSTSVAVRIYIPDDSE